MAAGFGGEGPSKATVVINDDEVQKLLNGDTSKIKEIKLNEGDLQLFKGRYALHRATRAEGNKTRNLVVFTYTEK